MRSSRTDASSDPFDGVSRPGFFSRLNVRLVMALSMVALVGLIVSGLAINQILPGYFAEQTRDRLVSAVASTELLITLLAEAQPPGVVQVAELRERFVLQQAADAAARIVASATVEIVDAEGQRVAYAEPQNFEALRGQGLRLDSGVEPASDSYRLAIPGRAEQDAVPYTITIRNPYTSRVTTIDQIRSAIFGAGVLALLVSLFVGILAARRVTAPIGHLRRVAARVAQGELDQRAGPSGVVEIDELGAQFNVMADRLGASLRMLEGDRDRLREFVADVSHELRTPIAALRTFTDLQQDGDVDETTRDEFLERSSEQISRLEWLSTNLLDLSRIDAGIFPLDMHWGDLRDPLRSVVEAHAEVAERRGVALTSEVPQSAVMLRFDRERIVQLVNNLVSNGLKFTPRGGHVLLQLTDGPAGASIEVRDSGPGIQPDELPRIFERFYRGTNTGEARASGSGLGLAIVRSIVEMHAGTIDVASVVGEGTVFSIHLPRSHSSEPAEDGKDQ